MGILRFLLAICVVTSHCGKVLNLPTMTGDVAVQLFYVISGFYMSIILNQKYKFLKNFYFIFISNRLLRLYPTYFIILILTLGLCLLASLKSGGKYHVILDPYFQNNLSISSIITLSIANIIILGQDLVMFLGLNTETGNLFFTSNFKLHSPELHTFLFVPQAWTLGLEIMFYLIAPFLLTKGLKKILIVISLSIVVRYINFYVFHFENDPWNYRFFPSELAFFLLGYISYYISIKNKLLKFNSKFDFILLLFFTIIILFYSMIIDSSIFLIPIGIKQLTITILFTLFLPNLFKLTEKNKFDRFIGELSYPIYISHMLVFMLLGMYGFNSSELIITVTILFAILLNITVNNKIEKFRQKRVLNRYS